MYFTKIYFLSTIIFIYLLYPISKINTILENVIYYKLYNDSYKDINLIIGSSPTQYAIDIQLFNQLINNDFLFISMASPINDIYNNEKLFNQIKKMKVKKIFIDKRYLFYKQYLKNKDFLLLNENIRFFLNGFNWFIDNDYKMKKQTNEDIQKSINSKILYNEIELEYIFKQIDLLHKNNIDIYLFETPYNQENSIILNEKSLNLIEKRTYFKYLDYKEIIYSDNNLFMNLSHLNKYGQKKFTEQFVNKVLNEFNK